MFDSILAQVLIATAKVGIGVATSIRASKAAKTGASLAQEKLRIESQTRKLVEARERATVRRTARAAASARRNLGAALNVLASSPFKGAQIAGGTALTRELEFASNISGLSEQAEIVSSSQVSANKDVAVTDAALSVLSAGVTGIADIAEIEGLDITFGEG